MVTSSVVPINYRKIPKISPGAPGLFSKALCEGLMYGGKFAFQNRFGKPSSWKEIYRFFCFILYLRAISKYKPPPRGGLIFGGAIQRRVFCVTILGGLYMEGLIFGILRYFTTNYKF